MCRTATNPLSHLRSHVAYQNLFYTSEHGVFDYVGSSGKKFLRTLPLGAYTFCRSVGDDKIFQLDLHLERLRKTHEDLTKRAVNYKTIEDLVRQPLANSLNELKNQQNWKDDFRFMIHIDNNGDMTMVGETLPTIEGPIHALARYATRNMGTTKSSAWTREAKFIQRGLPENFFNDVVMVNKDGFCTEGLETNFIAVHQDNTIQTASIGDGVLNGTVRSLLLDLCQEKEYKLVETAPPISDFYKWQGCALLSTSRLLLPVDTLHLDDNMQDALAAEEKPFHDTDFMLELQTLIRERVIDQAKEP